MSNPLDSVGFDVNSLMAYDEFNWDCVEGLDDVYKHTMAFYEQIITTLISKLGKVGESIVQSQQAIIQPSLVALNSIGENIASVNDAIYTDLNNQLTTTGGGYSNPQMEGQWYLVYREWDCGNYQLVPEELTTPPIGYEWYGPYSDPRFVNLYVNDFGHKLANQIVVGGEQSIRDGLAYRMAQYEQISPINKEISLPSVEQATIFNAEIKRLQKEGTCGNNDSNDGVNNPSIVDNNSVVEGAFQSQVNSQTQTYTERSIQGSQTPTATTQTTEKERYLTADMTWFDPNARGGLGYMYFTKYEPYGNELNFPYDLRFQVYCEDEKGWSVKTLAKEFNEPYFKQTKSTFLLNDDGTRLSSFHGQECGESVVVPIIPGTSIEVPPQQPKEKDEIVDMLGCCRALTKALQAIADAINDLKTPTFDAKGNKEDCETFNDKAYGLTTCAESDHSKFLKREGLIDGELTDDHTLNTLLLINTKIKSKSS